MPINAVPNEKELLLRVADGDNDAFAELFYGYHQGLGEFLLKITGSLELAQDIVQDTFIKVWLNRKDLPAIRSFSDYLFIMSRNRMINALRKKANERVRHLQWVKQFDAEDFQPEDADNNELYRRMLADAVEKLPPQQQKVYRMSRQQRLTHDQIAEQLGIATSTVKSHVKAALKSIRNELETQIDPMIILVLLTPFALQ